MDDSSRIILVEGNIGAGKSKLCKELAEQLDFLYVPEFSMEKILINGDGRWKMCGSTHIARL